MQTQRTHAYAGKLSRQLTLCPGNWRSEWSTWRAASGPARCQAPGRLHSNVYSITTCITSIIQDPVAPWVSKCVKLSINTEYHNDQLQSSMMRFEYQLNLATPFCLFQCQMHACMGWLLGPRLCCWRIPIINYLIRPYLKGSCNTWVGYNLSSAHHTTPHKVQISPASATYLSVYVD